MSPSATQRLTPEQRAEAARVGGRARWAAMTPEQRQSWQRQGRVASVVNNLIRRVTELAPEQWERLLVALLANPPDRGR